MVRLGLAHGHDDARRIVCFFANTFGIWAHHCTSQNPADLNFIYHLPETSAGEDDAVRFFFCFSLVFLVSSCLFADPISLQSDLMASLQSALYHHPSAQVLVVSNTWTPASFEQFRALGYDVRVVYDYSFLSCRSGKLTFSLVHVTIRRC